MISEDMRVRIAHSIAGLEQQRHNLAAAIADRMDSPTPLDRSGHSDLVSAQLLRLLIDGGSDIAAFGGLRDLSQVSLRHEKLGISGRHYSRFGLVLSSAMGSIFGLTMPPQTVAAWNDVFWIVVGEIGRAGDRQVVLQPKIGHLS